MYLKVENIKKYYGQGENKIEVLRGIDCGVEKGEMCVMLGPSGSGKSTLLNLIGGIEHIDGGHILVGDTDLSKLSRKELALYRRNTLGFIFSILSSSTQFNSKGKYRIRSISKQKSNFSRRINGDFRVNRASK